MRAPTPYLSDSATSPGGDHQPHSTPPQQGFNEYWPIIEKMVDHKLDAAEARTDVKVAGLEQKITSQTGQLVKWILGTASGGVVAIVGILLAVLAYGSDRFDGGVQGASLTVQQSQDAKRLAELNAQQVEALAKAIRNRDGQIDTLIKLMERRQ